MSRGLAWGRAVFQYGGCVTTLASSVCIYIEEYWLLISSMANFIERDERCIFVGNLEERVTDEILWELFLQVENETLYFDQIILSPILDYLV